jgi:DNA-binding CsgD family transcriptional regulator
LETRTNAGHSPSEESILDLIGHVYDASIVPSEWSTFLKKFSDMQRGAAIAMVAHNEADKTGEISYSVHCDAAWQESYARHFGETDIFVDRLRERGKDVGVWQGQNLIDGCDLTQSEFYNDWLEPQGMFHTVHCLALRESNKVVTLRAGRAKSLGRFSATELRAWELLLPHIRRSVHIQKLNTELASARNVMDGGLSRRSVGLILTKADGMIADTNGFADDLLTKADGLTSRFGKLVIDKKREQDRLEILINGAVGITLTHAHSGGGFLNVSRPSGREPYKVLVTPAPEAMPFLEKQGTAAAIYILDPEKDVELNLRELQELFGLTFAESNVAASIVKGMDVNETAAALNITRNTVRTHLKRVFEKSGTKRQSQLVLKILSTIP